MPRKQVARRGVQLCLTLGALACGPDRPVQVNARPAIGGTYEFRLCRGPCAGRDDSTSLAIGRLVLVDVAIDTAVYIRSDSARRLLRRQYLFEARQGPPNGCFVWDTRNLRGQSYGVGRAGGLLYWTAKDDSLFFRLYRSPDASHMVRALRTPTGFQGRGVSAGAGVADVHWPDDVVAGRWAGAPDFSVCNQAADTVLAEFRRFVRERSAIPKRLQN